MALIIRQQAVFARKEPHQTEINKVFLDEKLAPSHQTHTKHNINALLLIKAMLLLLLILSMVSTKKYIVLFNTPDTPQLMSISSQRDRNIEDTRKYFTEHDKIDRMMLNGYSATLCDSTVEKLRKNPSVAVVEEDSPVKIAMVDTDPYGLGFSLWESNLKDEAGLNRYNIMNKAAQETDTSLNRYNIMDKAARKTNTSFQNVVSTQASIIPAYENNIHPELVEEKIDFIMQENAPWGLSILSGHKTAYEYIPNGGKNVNVYVIDTGIDISHPDFGGRAIWGYNAVEGTPDRDEHGHGTHCAGIIGGESTGIARAANVIAVKTLNSRGEGLISSMIEGIEFVIRDHQKRSANFYEKLYDDIYSRGYGKDTVFDGFNGIFKKDRSMPKAVVSLSLGGFKSGALNFAIQYASRSAGIHFATAAGNENQNACNFSPASAPNSITVGATRRNNRIASFSNTGKCVDLYAPGVDINSTWPNGRYRTVSGTSMATPHVAGVMAIYLGLVDFKPCDLKERILKDTKRIVRDKSSVNAIPWFLDFNSGEGVKKPMASLEKLYYRLKVE